MNIQAYPTCIFFVIVPEQRIVEKANNEIGITNVVVYTPISVSVVETPSTNSIAFSNVEVGGPKFRNVTDNGNELVAFSSVVVFTPVTTAQTDSANNTIGFSNCVVYMPVTNSFVETPSNNNISFSSVIV